MNREKRDCKYQLSIAMIVKNEERILRQCLEALQPLRDAISCELIITDTGSTDGTIEIAKEFADTFLEFEWCNDFSAARNTGVNVSNGSWFLYIDADEVFDESIMNIAEFINSKDSELYDSGMITVRNYKTEKLDAYHDFIGVRLFNFNYTKRLYCGSIHECIPAIASGRYQIEAIVHHDGYIETIFTDKQERNQVLLEEELKKQPSDLRIIKLLMDATQEQVEAIKLGETGIAIAKETQQQNNPYMAIIYFKLCGLYLWTHNDDLLIKYSSEYFGFEPNHTLPKLEILLFLATMKERKKLDREAIDCFVDYQNCYNELKKMTDYPHIGCSQFPGFTEKKYVHSQLILSKLYHKVDDAQNAKKSLAESNTIEYIQESKDDKLLFSYIEIAGKLQETALIIHAYKTFIHTLSHDTKMNLFDTIIKYFKLIEVEKQAEFLELFNGEEIDSCIAICQLIYHQYDSSKCQSKTILTITEEPDIYDSLVFVDALYSSLLYANDIFGFFEHCAIPKLTNLANAVFYEHKDDNRLISTILSSEKMDDENNSKILMLHSHIALLNIDHLIKVIDNVTKENEDTLIVTALKLDLNNLFAYFVNTTYTYMLEIYNEEFLCEDNIDCLPAAQAFTFYAHQALDIKDSDMVGYIKYLKLALKYFNNMNDCVALLISDIEQQMNEVTQEQSEFDLLGEQIKQMIRGLITAGNKQSANEILGNYILINPSDVEIGAMQQLIDAL